MKKRLDYKRLTELKDEYLKQWGSQEEDLEILSMLDKGLTVVSVSNKFHRSTSSIYRLIRKAMYFLETYKEDTEKHDTEVPIPTLIFPQGSLSEDMLCLYRLCIACFVMERPHFIPFSSLQSALPSIENERCALRLTDEMKMLALDAWGKI